MSPPLPSVVIVDDHALFRAGVRAELFRPPIPRTIVDALLEEGWDVWLLNWRASIDFDPLPWTLCDAAVHDYPIAVRHIKHCVDEGLDLPLEQALSLERDYWAGLIPYRDYLEGVQAWLEKRQPDFPDLAAPRCG